MDKSLPSPHPLSIYPSLSSSVMSSISEYSSKVQLPDIPALTRTIFKAKTANAFKKAGQTKSHKEQVKKEVLKELDALNRRLQTLAHSAALNGDEQIEMSVLCQSESLTVACDKFKAILTLADYDFDLETNVEGIGGKNTFTIRVTDPELWTELETAPRAVA